jgi:hypothetical protein
VKKQFALLSVATLLVCTLATGALAATIGISTSFNGSGNSVGTILVPVTNEIFLQGDLGMTLNANKELKTPVLGIGAGVVGLVSFEAFLEGSAMGKANLTDQITVNITKSFMYKLTDQVQIGWQVYLLSYTFGKDMDSSYKILGTVCPIIGAAITIL